MKPRMLWVCFAILYFLSHFFSLALSPATLTASAQTASEYAYVKENNVYFYSSKDKSHGLFLLPKSYYVKMITFDPDFCFVEYGFDNDVYKKVQGYVQTSQLTFVDYTPKIPYLYHTFEVHYTIDDGFSQDSSFLTGITVQCSYYGDYAVGTKTYCYVLQGDSFGYVPKPKQFSYPINTEYDERLTPPALSPQSSNEEKKQGMSSSQIVLLVVLCLLVPTLSALILKPPKRPPYETDD